MKTNKRLKEVESYFKDDPHYRIYSDDAKWLISYSKQLENRVKCLTEALEFYADVEGNTMDGEGEIYGQTGDFEGRKCWDHDDGLVARKALEKK